ncbi:MAG: sensor histidine kinase N-terminal domain-containing protein [Proteobacteria bacterium]|nr:sensor histidine kinase N-terminal domain-containing protein [Pseudomonadota bacterium]
MSAAARRPGRLTVRLGVHLAVLLTAGIALAASVVAWRTIATIKSLDDAALQSQARLVAQNVRDGPDGGPVLHMPSELSDAFAGADSGSLFVIADADNAVLLASDLRAADLLAPYLPPPPEGGFFRVPPMAGFPDGLLGVLVPYGKWRVVVAQAHEQQEALVTSLVSDFAFSTVWLLVPIAGATVLIGVWTLRRGLAPLREASRAAAEIGPGTAGVRLPERRLPAEALPLVRAVNQALERLERALDAQRRFAGDAAHALRTPLAVLVARLDSAESAADMAALRQDAERLSRLVDQMLAIARLDGLPLDVSGPLDLRVVAASAVSALAPLAIARGVELALTGEAPPPLRGNAAAVETALLNLIDNAIAHAPPGSTVEVELAAPASVRVMDRGPGVPPGQAAKLFDRFHSGRSGGAGLGLAIVAGVAAAHGGSARVESRPSGGASFLLDLAGQHCGLAPRHHGADEIFAVQHAADYGAGDVEAHQPQQQVAGRRVQV